MIKINLFYEQCLRLVIPISACHSKQKQSSIYINVLVLLDTQKQKQNKELSVFTSLQGNVHIQTIF